MKKISYLYLVLFFYAIGYTQNIRVEMRSKNPQGQAIIDSIYSHKEYSNLTEGLKAANSLLTQLQKKGYLEATSHLVTPTSENNYAVEFELNDLTKSLHLCVKGCNVLVEQSAYPIENDTLLLPVSETDKFLADNLKKLEAKGESLAKLQLTNLERKKNYLCAQLIYTPENKRKLDALIIKGYPNFPAGHLTNLRKQNRKRPFNQTMVKQLKKEVDAYPFCTQIKSPEIQFTKDSTYLYIYVQKRNANSFDGLLGFSNNETKNIRLSGYVDLVLQNILNSGESIALNWKSDGKQQTTFAGQVDLPYVFNSPLALKAQLQITKQDSTFQNTKTAIQLGYLMRFHKRLYLGYQSVESSDIQNLNSGNLSDYTNHFTTLSYEYFNQTSESIFFSEKTSLSAQYGIGARKSPTAKIAQSFLYLKAKHDWALNEKNHLVLKNELYYLQSNTYLVNELGRFGGINSIIGFNENSLQANFYNLSRVEYRLQISPTLYWSTLFDYGLLQDQTLSKKTTTLSGLGTGIKLATKTGLLSLIYGTGTTGNQNINNKNALVHLSLKSYF